jgi:hypothetical protein
MAENLSSGVYEEDGLTKIIFVRASENDADILLRI